MFDKHRVFVADGMWLNRDSMNSMMSFFDSLPEHLMTRGVLYDAPFATITIADAHKCKADPAVYSYLTVTKRSFNIFDVQARSARRSSVHRIQQILTQAENVLIVHRTLL